MTIYVRKARGESPRKGPVHESAEEAPQEEQIREEKKSQLFSQIVKL